MGARGIMSEFKPKTGVAIITPESLRKLSEINKDYFLDKHFQMLQQKLYAEAGVGKKRYSTTAEDYSDQFEAVINRLRDLGFKIIEDLTDTKFGLKKYIVSWEEVSLEEVEPTIKAEIKE